MKDDDKPRLEKPHETWEVHPGHGVPITVCVGANQIVEIDKLYGPLCSHDVRIRLEYTNDKSDWVVEIRQPEIDAPWIEKARWDCQEGWPDDE